MPFQLTGQFLWRRIAADRVRNELAALYTNVLKLKEPNHEEHERHEEVKKLADRGFPWL